MVKDILAVPEEFEKIFYLILRSSKTKVESIGEEAKSKREIIEDLLRFYESLSKIKLLSQIIPNFSTFIGVATIYFSDTYEKKILLELKDILDDQWLKLSESLISFQKKFPKTFSIFSFRLFQDFEDFLERREKIKRFVGTTAARVLNAEDVLKISEILKEKYELDSLFVDKAMGVVREIIQELKK
ncbi:hypothetical protein DRN63_05110 [Nanoarchaeota archaeon]|nr:MAG: hypothetical protein DRN63_05110 [Nanoarchaeota archaeon]